MTSAALNSADLNTALDAVKATYEQLVKDGIDPSVVVIAMSEIVAYCLVQKNLTGGGDQTYNVWLTAFEMSYRDQLHEAKGGQR